MKQPLLLFFFLFLVETCFCQIDFVNNKTILPGELKDQTVNIKATLYQADTVQDEFEMLTAKYDNDGKLKLKIFHHKIIIEHYYSQEATKMKYSYYKHKETVKTSAKYAKRRYGNWKSIRYFKDTILVKTKHVTAGRLKWVRSTHRKGHLEWKRRKQVTRYTYDLIENSYERNDKDGNRYVSQFNKKNQCTRITYSNRPYYSSDYRLSWLQSFQYDSTGNVTEMVETNETGDINWRETFEYSESGLLVCNKLYQNGNRLFVQVNFSYQGEVLLQREDIDLTDNSKKVYKYTYK